MDDMYHFHIGRGGPFHNAGCKKFCGMENPENIDVLMNIHLKERTGNGRFAYVYIDDVGNEIITKKEYEEGIKRGRLVIDFDGMYDSDIFCSEDMLTEQEQEILEECESSW